MHELCWYYLATSSSTYIEPFKKGFDEYWGAKYAIDGYNSLINYKVFHSGYELFPFLYITFSQPISSPLSIVEICNICSANGWYDYMELNVMVKQGKIAAMPGQKIKDGRKCNTLQAPPGTFHECQCKNITCIKPMSGIKTVAIQRIRKDRRRIFSNEYHDIALQNWDGKYSKPIRTFLMISEVRFY